MTRRQTRQFFIIGTTLSAIVFLGLTVDSHLKFPQLTHENTLTAHVIEGKHVWHRKNCINCHTLLGEGAYYAPDLTKIAQQRGDAYLRQFLKNPSRFYSEQLNGRIMPNPQLTDDEIDSVIAFLTWVSHIDNQGWPPRPIVVSAATPQGIALGTTPPPAASQDPVALGEALFRASPPACFSCHSTQENVVLVGPSLAGIGTRAGRVIHSDAYKGNAHTPEEYIRESILSPSAYVVAGPTFSAEGRSIMPPYADVLKPQDVDHLVAYLATLK